MVDQVQADARPVDLRALDESVMRSLDQVMSVQDTGSWYRMSRRAPEPTLLSLCFGILTLELYGQDFGFSRDEWIHSIRSAQDQRTGLFVDPLLQEGDLLSNSLGLDYLYYQTTYFGLNALDALDASPAHPLKFIEPFMRPGSAWSWMSQLDWSNPWRESNWVMFVAAALEFEWRCNGSDRALRTLHEILDWLDANQDPRTGYWGTDLGASVVDGMAAAYHFVPFYYYLSRPVQLIERLVDSTLQLQQDDGLFHAGGGGESCLDVDAVDLLAKCGAGVPAKRDEIERALDRALRGLLRNLDDDGGFCSSKHRPYPKKTFKRRAGEVIGLDKALRRPYKSPRHVSYYSGWSKMPFDVRQSDAWSTWFRSYAIAVINTEYPEKFANSYPWRFRSVPALGWHDSKRIHELHRDRTFVSAIPS